MTDVGDFLADVAAFGTLGVFRHSGKTNKPCEQGSLSSATTAPQPPRKQKYMNAAAVARQREKLRRYKRQKGHMPRTVPSSGTANVMQQTFTTTLHNNSHYNDDKPSISENSNENDKESSEKEQSETTPSIKASSSPPSPRMRGSSTTSTRPVFKMKTATTPSHLNKPKVLVYKTNDSKNQGVTRRENKLEPTAYKVLFAKTKQGQKTNDNSNKAEESKKDDDTTWEQIWTGKAETSMPVLQAHPQFTQGIDKQEQGNQQVPSPQEGEATTTTKLPLEFRWMLRDIQQEKDNGDDPRVAKKRVTIAGELPPGEKEHDEEQPRQDLPVEFRWMLRVAPTQELDEELAQDDNVHDEAREIIPSWLDKDDDEDTLDSIYDFDDDLTRVSGLSPHEKTVSDMFWEHQIRLIDKTFLQPCGILAIDVGEDDEDEEGLYDLYDSFLEATSRDEVDAGTIKAIMASQDDPETASVNTTASTTSKVVAIHGTMPSQGVQETARVTTTASTDDAGTMKAMLLSQEDQETASVTTTSSTTSDGIASTTEVVEDATRTAPANAMVPKQIVSIPQGVVVASGNDLSNITCMGHTWGSIYQAWDDDEVSLGEDFSSISSIAALFFPKGIFCGIDDQESFSLADDLASQGLISRPKRERQHAPSIQPSPSILSVKSWEEVGTANFCDFSITVKRRASRKQ